MNRHGMNPLLFGSGFCAINMQDDLYKIVRILS